MKTVFEKSDLQKAKPLLEEYLQSLTGVADDSWERHILEADIYEICDSTGAVGCFSIFGNERITMFYLRPAYIHLSQDIFKSILEKFSVKNAFVTTVDSLFLSLCMDFHKKIEMQAYFFDGECPRKVPAPEYGRELLMEVDPAEIPGINARTDNFFDFPAQWFETQAIKVYRLAKNGTDLGYGILCPNPLNPRYYSCGMVTLPEHRQKGVGRSIQIHLADICREKGAVPVSECWYCNTLSKKTIESAGRYSRIRLLKVWFCEPK